MAAKEKTEPVTLETKIKELQKSLEDKYGLGVFVRASDLPPLRYISTGSIILDRGIGGGFPKGRFNIITGAKHSGKSFIAYKTLVEYQKIDERPAIIIDFEKAYSKEWSERVGINNDNVFICQPETMNQGINVARNFISKHLTGFVLIDSLASGAPKEEMERSSDEDERAVGARMWNKAFRTLQGALNSKNDKGETSDCCIILINQNRTGFAAGFSYVTQPGGAGKDYAASVQLILKKENDLIKKDNAYMIRKNEDKEEIKICGVETRFSIDKCKVAPSLGREGVFRIIFDDPNDGGNYDNIYEVFYFAKRYRIIKVTSNGFVSYGEQQWRGIANFMAVLREDKSFREGLINEIKAVEV